MFKVTIACEDHGHVLLVAKVNGILVFDRAARLNHSRDPLLAGNLHTIGKREKGIGGHHSSFQIKTK